jgi:hypothetical protein
MALVLACWCGLRSRRRVQSGIAGVEVGAAEGRVVFASGGFGGLMGTTAPESGCGQRIGDGLGAGVGGEY